MEPLAANPARDTYLGRMIGLDVIVAVLGAFVASWRLDNLSAWSYLPILVGTPLLWVSTLALANAYERRFRGVGLMEYQAVLRAGIGLLAVVAIAAYATKQDLARWFTLILVVLLCLGGLLTRQYLRWWLHRRRLDGQLMQRAIVVGRADAVARLIRSLRADPMQGLAPVGACASGLDSAWPNEATIEGVPVVGPPEGALWATHSENAEAVVVAADPDLSGEALRRLSWALEERDIELIVCPGMLDIAVSRMTIRPSTDLALLHIDQQARRTRNVLLKKLMDRVLSALLVLTILPLLAAVALAIKVCDGGPVFYRQRRVGVQSRRFEMFKFRTMCVDADRALPELAGLSDGNGVLFKMKADPRVTAVGRFLRRYSLDELPQLFNVLRGEMSLVGPRPPLEAEVERYEPDALRRLHVLPGMTGLWQVSGRSDLSWDASLALDLRYVDNWSPIVDLTILMRTASAVVRASGAY